MPGYDVKVVKPLKVWNASLICPECKLFLRDAVQTDSGILLCESCLKQILKCPNSTSPKSKITVGKKYYTDKAVQREILKLLVLCSHFIYGCPWQGQLQHFEGHCQDCKYKPVRCTNPGCSELMPTEKLDSHVGGNCPFRKVTCNHCMEEIAANMLEDHLNWCPKVPPIQASTSCVLSEVKYFQPSFGASSFTYNGLHNKSRQVESQLNVWVLQNGSYLWRIPQVSQHRQSTAAINSPPFFTAQTGYKMCIGAYLNGNGSGYKTHLSLHFILMKGDYDPLLKWPFDYKVTFILVDQTKRRHICDSFYPDHNPVFNRPLFDSNGPYHLQQFTDLSVLDDTCYIKEDVMYIKCIVDTRNMFHP